MCEITLQTCVRCEVDASAVVDGRRVDVVVVVDEANMTSDSSSSSSSNIADADCKGVDLLDLAVLHMKQPTGE